MSGGLQDEDSSRDAGVDADADADADANANAERPEKRIRTSSRYNDGGQEMVFIYKVGGCMKEKLVQLWKQYESISANDDGAPPPPTPTLEIRIPLEHVTTKNCQVRSCQLWGTDVYTDHSDLVAVLMHIGYCKPKVSPPLPSILEFRVTARVLPPRESYISTERNKVRSRAWGGNNVGCSYSVEGCWIVKKGGGTVDLEPLLMHSSSVEPTLVAAPVVADRSAAAWSALLVREVTVQYNLCNEPWMKYSISIVADKGLSKPFYTHARLKKGDVLYLETISRRYELCFSGEKLVEGHRGESESAIVDVFRWSRCNKPLPQTVMQSLGIPLPLDRVVILEENIEWEDVEWSETGVMIAGKEYKERFQRNRLVWHPSDF
ncbi:Histone deacetylation protein Rxt3 [Dillenia turbinata]|uniref:Histone deacetylation protein Rxt3 n=1 Tax=Dillenia turbinata TaxID=194707 RepID=A0AAN8ZU93_9MAGN